MPSGTSPKLGIPYIDEGQEAKEDFHQEGVLRLEAFSPLTAIDKNLNIPPGAPSVGDVYIVSSAGSSAWSGESRNIALYIPLAGTTTTGAEWDFTTPSEGMYAYLEDENDFYLFDGSSWQQGITPVNKYDIGSFYNGLPSTGVYWRYVTPRAFDLADNFSGSQSWAGTPATTTGSHVLNVQKNGTKIGDITFTSVSSGSFNTSGTGTESFSIGDRLEIVNPSTHSQLADVSVVFKGTLS